jgi:hypothetical protein
LRAAALVAPPAQRAPRRSGEAAGGLKAGRGGGRTREPRPRRRRAASSAGGPRCVRCWGVAGGVWPGVGWEQLESVGARGAPGAGWALLLVCYARLCRTLAVRDSDCARRRRGRRRQPLLRALRRRRRRCGGCGPPSRCEGRGPSLLLGDEGSDDSDAARPGPRRCAWLPRRWGVAAWKLPSAPSAAPAQPSGTQPLAASHPRRTAVDGHVRLGGWCAWGPAGCEADQALSLWAAAVLLFQQISDA